MDDFDSYSAPRAPLVMSGHDLSQFERENHDFLGFADRNQLYFLAIFDRNYICEILYLISTISAVPAIAPPLPLNRVPGKGGGPDSRFSKNHDFVIPNFLSQIVARRRLKFLRI